MSCSIQKCLYLAPRNSAAQAAIINQPHSTKVFSYFLHGESQLSALSRPKQKSELFAVPPKRTGGSRTIFKIPIVPTNFITEIGSGDSRDLGFVFDSQYDIETSHWAVEMKDDVSMHGVFILWRANTIPV